MKIKKRLGEAIQASTLFFLVLICSLEVQAMPADSTPYYITQPDGSSVQVRQLGDEHGSWVETLSGHTIAKAPDGFWKYVERYNGRQPILSNQRAGAPGAAVQIEPSRPTRPEISTSSGPWFDESQLNGGPLNPSVLYILVDYADTPATYTDIASWADQISSGNAEAKSIANYYQEASYGAVTISPANESYGSLNDGVIGWLRLSGNHPVNRPIEGVADMAIESDQILLDAMEAADPYINFAAYDLNQDLFVDSKELAIVIVVAGHEAASVGENLPNIWAHAKREFLAETSDVVYEYEEECTPVSPNVTSKPGYIGPTEICEDVLVDEHSIFSFRGAAEMGEIHGGDHQVTLGTPVHELGHLIFGLPDLYDTGLGDTGGIGLFGLMASGNWGMDPSTDSYSGETPVLPSAWSQYKLGWVTSRAWGPISSAGRDNIPIVKPVVGIAHVGSEVGPGMWQCSGLEYFLMQYRTGVGYDLGMRGFLSPDAASFTPGLLILHVDETQNSNSNQYRRLVDVEEANGMDINGTPTYLRNNSLWFNGNYSLFNHTTVPNSNPNIKTVGSISMENSGVAVEVFNSSVGFSGVEQIDVQIDSACDAAQWSIQPLP